MIEFKLPSMGADMDEGTLLEWKVKPGDVVKKGQVVAIVDTSKAAVDIESWQEGTIDELMLEAGEKVPVGTTIATLLEPGEAPPATRPARKPSHEAGGPVSQTISAGAPVGVPLGANVGAPATRRKISPAARKRAQQLHIDLDTVIPTGPDGAVMLEDVERSSAIAGGAAPEGAGGDRLAAMRRTIAAAMERSKREIPHYYVSETIPLGRMLAWLIAENAKRSIEERLLAAVPLIKAVALTLRRFPDLNGFYRDGGFHAAPRIHVGIAISLRHGGLVAPALLDADTKPLAQLMRELSDLTSRCRAGSLRSSELSEPTITVTSLGDQGSSEVLGIIYPPQVALVGFGRVAERPWAEHGGLKVMPTVTASLSADHRVTDGHRGARFLVELGETLQHPEELDQ
ncbi:2-oxo acid dehydrogenase subunit E2 [Paraburkholderia sp. UYCP14C]|uniref:dihydrolipoamide acetyltransferase family protein n=1 Tax=Paraburkholderia sp. UYCP14C TaxID=2511130 RepID=UPI00101EBD5C|nr:dihydrolipoamide acetyltransferase family protein [Paraburkholderia sp. UYCP14C]RZF25663.1 2-oxo acid dehydrogenase subunit E2 [Paraburkholderia sp. UYCP14C]